MSQNLHSPLTILPEKCVPNVLSLEKFLHWSGEYGIRTAIFLLLCQKIQVWKCEIVTADPAVVMNQTDRYHEPVDFRCFSHALEDDFDFENFNKILYTAVPHKQFEPLKCTGTGKKYYPVLKGTDPMMPYYINNLYKGIALATETRNIRIAARMSPIERMKEYCAYMQYIAAAFLEYWEKFHSESDLCMKMAEFIKICHEFRQTREIFAAKLYEKLCLSEEGCYSVMRFYDYDLPYCVKNTAIGAFKNSSVGSWHHAIINYCKLTGMVSEAKAEKYDRAILTENGITKENLRDMCLYLRYRLLPEEGKEQEIPEDVADYDTFDTETTTEYQTEGAILFALGWWNVVLPILATL